MLEQAKGNKKRRKFNMRETDTIKKDAAFHEFPRPEQGC